MKSNQIHFQIATPESVVMRDDVEKISIPTELGQITVLPNHAPLVSVLTPGELTIYKDGKAMPYAVAGGFVEIRPGNRVVILADAAEHVEAIDLEHAQKAVEEAQKLMSQKFTDDVKFAEASAMLERSLSRLRVARKHRHGSRATIDSSPGATINTP